MIYFSGKLKFFKYTVTLIFNFLLPIKIINRIFVAHIENNEKQVRNDQIDFKLKSQIKKCSKVKIIAAICLKL